MNRQLKQNSIAQALSAILSLFFITPFNVHAQISDTFQTGLPVEMSLTTFLIMGALLLATIILFFLFQTRFKTTYKELKIITTELSQTRERLTQKSHTLKKTELNLKNTTTRYQGILFDAQVGMFQMDLDGKCTYINSALQQLSGLYPKKALQEGLQSAIHPEDRNPFDTAWKFFIQNDESALLFFRFKHAKGQDVHVVCRASKVLNERKDVESYIGWVSDVTQFHKERLQQEVITARYSSFMEETIEGYYQLTPETPIPLTTPPDKMAATIMEQMTLTACNETFASLYGDSISSLTGKSINTLQGGCGPFKNNETIKQLIEAEYKLINFESIRQDPRGNRLSLLNNVVGLVEDNKLIGIWGSQRNISQQKREKEELTSQTQFMRRILNALPADVHVKDTRCRYLYASQKLASRTGIPQENWIGKTIFEVIPATSRDHDKNAIDVMKSGKLRRVEYPYEAHKKSGWMETIQIPLISSAGLVEGVVGLSLEISDRKKKEEELIRNHQQLDQQLHHRTRELQKTESELGQTTMALQNSNQKLVVREAELENHQHEFQKQLKAQKHEEELLRHNEDQLITRQKQLKEQLSKRLLELDKETNKRKKWEELITIKESELRKLEELSNTRKNQLTKEISQREQTAINLAKSQSELKRNHQELDHLAKESKQEFHSESTARKKAEALFQQAQERIKILTEKYSTELEHEVAERKVATKKLIQNTDELDELKQEFNIRIEQATKTLKQELAKKQIREKALRQQEKDLEARLSELGKMLQLKSKEFNQQIEAREGAEAQRKQIEQKLEQMNTRQTQLIERETQKLNLNIAEIRLNEIKLRKKVSDLQQTKEELESILEIRAIELDNASKEQQKIATCLTKTQKEMENLSKNQAALVAKEGEALLDELKQLKKTEYELKQQDELLQKQSKSLENTLCTANEKLKRESEQRNKVEQELGELKIAFNASQDNTSDLLEQHTQELRNQIKEHQKNEAGMQKDETALKTQIHQLQQTITLRSAELTEAKKAQQKIETELAQAIERASLNSEELESHIEGIKKEHQTEIEQLENEHIDLRKNENRYRSLFQSSADALFQINPKSGKIQSANLAAARLFGEKSTALLINKTIGSLSPKQQPNKMPSFDMAKARLHSTIETGHDSFEWHFNKSDQTRFHSLVSLSTIDIEGILHILAVVLDISELKQQQTELQQSLDEAHSANRTNSKIVDELNETIQTSLNPIVESSATIEKAENLSVDQKLDMAVINRNSRSLIDMMNYRQELSHLAEGSNDYVPVKCDLHDLIKNLDHQFCQRAETKKLFFAVGYAQYQSANNVPKLVETDEHKIRKILTILLGYALAHTDKGRLGLHAERKSSDEKSITLAFELAYTGAHQKDKLLTRIFTPENLDKEAVDTKYGLSLARRYIHLLGGEISLEYRDGDVTVLTLVFPFNKVASEIVLPHQENKRTAGAA